MKKRCRLTQGTRLFTAPLCFSTTLELISLFKFPAPESGDYFWFYSESPCLKESWCVIKGIIISTFITKLLKPQQTKTRCRILMSHKWLIGRRSYGKMFLLITVSKDQHQFKWWNERGLNEMDSSFWFPSPLAISRSELGKQLNDPACHLRKHERATHLLARRRLWCLRPLFLMHPFLSVVSTLMSPASTFLSSVLSGWQAVVSVLLEEEKKKKTSEFFLFCANRSYCCMITFEVSFCWIRIHR